jgi:hypothetical protein
MLLWHLTDIGVRHTEVSFDPEQHAATRGVRGLYTSAVASADSIGRRATCIAGWEFQLGWKKKPKPSFPSRCRSQRGHRP